MRPHLYACLLALPLSLWGQEAPEPTLSTAQGDSFPGDIGPHHRVHAWTTTERDAAGQVREVLHRVVEIASGMHYWDG